jgi:acyl carrier protein
MTPVAPTTHRAIEAQVREVLEKHGRLNLPAAGLTADADLYQAGLSSHASVNVMLALEGAFDLEFPDRLLTRGVFQSIASISDALAELGAG